jgi:hypothetical protein
LYAGLGIAGGGEGIGDIGAPANDLLVLIIVEDGRDLRGGEALGQRFDRSHKEQRPALTFCFVYEPAPGHSVIMSSLASLFVAKAKATPEKVVP